MTTLDDLTPQELADHKGTWIDVPHKPYPVIYMGDFESTGDIKHGAVILDPRYGTNYERLDNCTPRPDLPRAWTQDGKPPAGEWEHAHISALGESTRRWIGNWEEA